jgi:aminoglycoside phosphotransferase
MSAKEITLSKLKKAKHGITVNDCPVGFRLSAVIFELRKEHDILMVKEMDYSNGYERIIGRYIYKGTLKTKRK